MRKIVIVNLIKTISLIFCLIFVLTAMAIALDYPTKTVQIIVPYPPGGTQRYYCPNSGYKTGFYSWTTSDYSKQTRRRRGSRDQICFHSQTRWIYRSNFSPGIVMIPILNPGIGFKLEDFTPIGVAVSLPSAITVKADAPWKTLEELVKDARKNPGKFTYSTAGPGTTPHFAGELFKVETGSDIVHVPMGGEAPAVTGLLGGHVDMTFVGLGAVSAHLKAGTLRALALMYPRRIKDFPDIPPTKELGYPNLMTTIWHGYFFPAKTPKEIVEKVAKAFETALKDKEVINKIEKTGMLVEGLILDEANKFFQNEEKKWSEVAKKAKMVE